MKNDKTFKLLIYIVYEYYSSQNYFNISNIGCRLDKANNKSLNKYE